MTSNQGGEILCVAERSWTERPRQMSSSRIWMTGIDEENCIQLDG